jgi:hypothetical protein
MALLLCVEFTDFSYRIISTQARVSPAFLSVSKETFPVATIKVPPILVGDLFVIMQLSLTFPIIFRILLIPKVRRLAGRSQWSRGLRHEMSSPA